MFEIPPLSLYVHIPWCVRKCPYCDFNSHAVQGLLPEDDYVAALLADLDRELLCVSQQQIMTIFIGGGTPSLFSPSAIGRLLEGIARRVLLPHDVEITLEANPGTTDANRFKGFRAAGVNRLSIGVQSFDDAKLRSLGRIHDGADAIRAVQGAQDAGFSNLNIDLMFGLPGQATADALGDVKAALALSASHLSFYQLTLEPHTLFHKYPPALPDEDSVWQAQQQCHEVLEGAGFRQYEVSAYARDGFRCRHNLNYWRFGDYIGIGAGAHGKITDMENGRILRTTKLKRPESYLAMDEKCRQVSTIADEDLPLEFVLNHLRLKEGFPEALFPARTGLSLQRLEPTLSDCERDGLLSRTDGIIRCSEHGWNFLDNILTRFAS